MLSSASHMVQQSAARRAKAKCLDLLSLLSCTMCNRARSDEMVETKTQQDKYTPSATEALSKIAIYCCWGSGWPIV